MGDWTYNATPTMENSTNSSIDLGKTVSLIVISACSLLGNLCTVAIVSSFKQHKLPDVLVIGLACTDLIATFIPVPMTLYSYITLDQFDEGSFSCKFYGTVAQFTRYASVLIVTLISLERYLAVNQPFIYRKHATPLKCVSILVLCWVIAFALALAPVLHNGTAILSHDGFCLFDFSSNYAISILAYAGVQYCIVLVCFVLVTAKLLRVYRRRKRLQVQGTYNQRSQAKEREHEVTFTRPKLTSRISDIGIALKKAAPILTERFQLGVEAQFARMLFAVVALFYVSWTTLVILIVIAQAKGKGGQSLALFWGIRLSVISLALNPLLYGLLARQYRMAYLYVLRRILSSCCSTCIHPPTKNIFATARAPGGEAQGESRARRLTEQHYGSRSNRIMNGNVWSGRANLPVLTHTTHLSLDLLPQVDEQDYIVQEESVHEHSTYLPSTGELSSTVIIPQQARESCNHGTPDIGFHKQPRASSQQLITESGHPQLEMNPGSHNPLAVVADIEGESAVTDMVQPKKQFPPLEAFDPEELNAGKVFENPIYDKEKMRDLKERNSVILSRTTPLSMLRSSKRARLQAKFSTSKQNGKNHTTEVYMSTNEFVPTKRSVGKTKSHPLSFLNSGEKRQKLKTTLSIPHTVSGEEEGVFTLIDSSHLTSPFSLTSGQSESGNITRASARMYSETKSSKHARTIPSSQSFADNLMACDAVSGFERETAKLAARYQLSVSPIPPQLTSESPPTQPTTSSPSSEHPAKTTTNVSFPKLTSSLASVFTPATLSPLPSSDDSLPFPKMTQTPLKRSVMELCKRFESLSSTPPSSPKSCTSPTTTSKQDGYTLTDQDSVITEI